MMSGLASLEILPDVTKSFKAVKGATDEISSGRPILVSSTCVFSTDSFETLIARPLVSRIAL